MLRNAPRYGHFETLITEKMDELTKAALDPRTPLEKTQELRVRLQQLKAVKAVARGDSLKL